MIAVNKNLSNLNMYDITAFMFNDGKTLSTATANAKIGRFSSATFTEAGLGTYEAVSSRTWYCYGVTNGVQTEICKITYYIYATYYWNAQLNVNNVVVSTSSTGSRRSYDPLNMSFSFVNGILNVTLEGVSAYSITANTYDYIYFTKTINNCADLIIFDDQQNYFITNQDGLSLLKKINTEIYNGNTTLSAMFTSYSTFSTNLNSAKTYMQTNNKATIAETSATFYSVDRPAMKYKYDKTNRNVILYTKRPMKITPSIVHNGTDTFYLVHIPKNLNSDSIFTGFLNSSTNLSVNQFIVAAFKIGVPSDNTADIKIDYINRIDTIDELNIKLKLSNIIKQ